MGKLTIILYNLMGKLTADFIMSGNIFFNELSNVMGKLTAVFAKSSRKITARFIMS